jgi:hypothetical protein
MSEKRPPRVYVNSKRSDLDLALAETLSHALGESASVRIGDPEKTSTGNIIVTTDGASSPTDVLKLAEDGGEVVVLAALPNEVAEAGYRKAGARAYLPMIVAAAPLVAAVAAIAAALAERF